MNKMENISGTRTEQAMKSLHELEAEEDCFRKKKRTG